MRAGGVVQLAVARRGAQRRLHLGQRLLELRARGQRLGQPVPAARHLRRDGQRLVELALRFVEQARRPQRVGVDRHRFGIARRVVAQRRRFALRFLELADQQRRLHDADARPQLQRRIVGVGGESERLTRFVEARLLVEQRGELELQLGIVAGAAALRRRSRRRHTRPRPAVRVRPSAYWPSLEQVGLLPGCSRACRRRGAPSSSARGRRPAPGAPQSTSDSGRR